MLDRQRCCVLDESLYEFKLFINLVISVLFLNFIQKFLYCLYAYILESPFVTVLATGVSLFVSLFDLQNVLIIAILSIVVLHEL